ncbi:MAG: hypothetical protein JWL90_1164, partial [Chthoniobacteraceae bacterium]|nr:hypothetical protein [Chthoniobacteraceae bacterium]
MNDENKIQALIHKLEQGGWASWIRRLLLVAVVFYVGTLWLFQESGFKGLAHEKAMEQAQISREIARGNGFSTKMIRPAALWQFQAKKGALPMETIPDTYHAPLNPYINSFFLLLVKKSWLMTQKDLVYICDKILVAVQLGFFLLAVLINYFTATPTWRSPRKVHTEEAIRCRSVPGVCRKAASP